MTLASERMVADGAASLEFRAPLLHTSGSHSPDEIALVCVCELWHFCLSEQCTGDLLSFIKALWLACSFKGPGNVIL